MKDNKGFTLIELLAIILIIAILAVVTVPIIMSSIESAKYGAAQDSAYGFKDAVNRFYSERLFDGVAPGSGDGTYTINSQGKLQKNNDEPFEIKVSGRKPNGGSIVIERDELKEGCLQYRDYAVVIVDGEVGEPEKGNCSGV